MNKKADALKFSLFFVVFSFFVAACTVFLCLFGSFLKAHAGTKTPVIDSEYMPLGLHCIVIDAGHGGEDGGTVGQNGVLEKDINLSLSQTLYDLLYINNVNVVMTRTEDKMLYDRYPDHEGRKKMYDLRARIDITNEIEGAILFSIHMNSNPDKSCRGAQVYYSVNHAEGYKIAGKVQNYIKEQLQPDNKRKIKPASSNIYLLDRIECPAVLVECGFLSNTDECKKLCEGTYQKQMACSIFAAMTDYLVNK